MCALLTGVQTCALPISLQRTDSRSADHSSPGADIPPNCARKAPVAGRRPGLIMADLEERDPISGTAADTAARHQLTGLISRPAPLMAWTRLSAMTGWVTKARLPPGKTQPPARYAATRPVGQVLPIPPAIHHTPIHNTPWRGE